MKEQALIALKWFIDYAIETEHGATFNTYANAWRWMNGVEYPNQGER